MRNHNEKARDMARSVLPSTARKDARETRAQIHGRERARERRVLFDLRWYLDPDDFEGELGNVHRRELAWMVADRREADKVGSLLRWAERTVEHDPELSCASREDRETYFRKLLPPGLIGNHAISHLWWVLDDRPGRHLASSRRSASAADRHAALVEDVIAAGYHGELNRRIKSSVAPVVLRTVWLPTEWVVDEEHPHPGVLSPPRRLVERRHRYIRFLGGAPDVESFVKEACWEVKDVVRAFHAEAIRPRSSKQYRT